MCVAERKALWAGNNVITGVKRKSNWIDDWQKLSDDGSARRFEVPPRPVYAKNPAPPSYTPDPPHDAPYGPPDFLKSVARRERTHEQAREYQREAAPSRSSRPSASRSPTISSPRRRRALTSQPLYWIYEEISFTMSKLSVFGAIVALCVLAALLFIGGFLTAYNFYTHQEVRSPGNPWVMAHQAPPSQEGGQSRHAKGQGGALGRFAAHNPLTRQATQATHHLMDKPTAALHNLPGLSGRGGVPSRVMSRAGHQVTRALHPSGAYRGGGVVGGADGENAAPPRVYGPIQQSAHQQFAPPPAPSYDGRQVPADQRYGGYVNSPASSPMQPPYGRAAYGYGGNPPASRGYSGGYSQSSRDPSLRD